MMSKIGKGKYRLISMDFTVSNDNDYLKKKIYNAVTFFKDFMECAKSF